MNFALLLTALLASAPAQATLAFQAISQEEAASLLSSHPVWESIAVTDSSSLPGELAAQETVQSMKKWKLTSADGVAALQEQTHLTIAVNCEEVKADPENGNLEKMLSWTNSSFPLRGNIPSEAFYFQAMQSFERCNSSAPEAPPLLQKFSGDRLLLTYSGTYPVKVLLLPEVAARPFAFAPSRKRNQAWTAPIGPLKDMVKSLFHLSAEDSAYLHHDLAETKPVILDSAFPAEFRPAVQYALDEWNSALGKRFFVLAEQAATISPLDCYSSSKVCFAWSGKKELAWAGLTCFGSSSFDPESGKIIGGVITCKNSAGPDALKPTPRDLEEKYWSGSLDLETVASMYLRRDDFTQVAHPDPVGLLKFFFTHEMGHINGFGHNLMGSTVSDVHTPSPTVMEYSPFPLFGPSFSKPGAWDLETLQLVYGGRELSDDFRYCSDLESENFLAKITKTARKANCNKFDLGAPDEWFLLLARLGDKGVLTPDPYSKEPLAASLGLFLLDSAEPTALQKTRAKNFLCASKTSLPAVTDYLKTHLSVTLECD